MPELVDGQAGIGGGEATTAAAAAVALDMVVMVEGGVRNLIRRQGRTPLALFIIYKLTRIQLRAIWLMS